MKPHTSFVPFICNVKSTPATHKQIYSAEFLFYVPKKLTLKASFETVKKDGFWIGNSMCLN